MKTEIRTFESKELIEELNSNMVIAFPTETVFGLAVTSKSQEAFDHLVKVKRRPPNKPFTLMCGTNVDLNKYAFIDKNIKRVLSIFTPGPITLLLSPRPNLPEFLTLNSNKIGIRIPGSKDLLAFLNKLSYPLLVPSANKSGKLPLKNSTEVYNEFVGEVSSVVIGNCQGGLPSTIVDLSVPNKISLIRQGELAYQKIVRIFKGE
ncbi:MAG: L-threonylcarbamoyladenylate synthase [Bacilli bacterium]|nr:L-threonylcarbamoyladenylate synthase [Bacilli bacterium]